MEYSIKEASELLGVSTDTIRRRIRKGEIKAHKVEGKNGLQWAIHEAELTGSKGAQLIEVIPVKRELNPELLQDYIREAISGVIEASEARHNEKIEGLEKQVRELTETVQKLNEALETPQESKTIKRWWKPWARD